MPRSVAGITASSSQQVLLQTIYNLSLSPDKVSLWGAFSICRTACLYQTLVHVDGCLVRTHSWFYPQWATQNPSIRLVFRSPQLTSTAGCLTAFLPLNFLFVRSSLNPDQEITLTASALEVDNWGMPAQVYPTPQCDSVSGLMEIHGPSHKTNVSLNKEERRRLKVSL